ncbi:hypothetical protein Q0Z83_025490 [Actinoplanes sichuanensis]|uniref:Toll/interleukin-1 receptor domain-containing protein n=1 Tax=Actinoplanes sichuanensis TaxID=512349 RepID=A0ABW4A0S7_9ACTN|nr:toll/interleukin-1 receptor domain-containing protein [Actinoplanes sichuanensis]BEL04358.1 hypothetical protein Q0Z83_025490 [Actinoplanes sichuanensis]
MIDEPTVFISHSSTCSDPGCGCAATRDAAVRLVEQADCRSILDVHELRIGEDWHQRLLEELSESRACIALLSPHALVSDHVFEELLLAKILSNLTGSTFRVLPVLVGGATRTQLKDSRLAKLRLDMKHMPQWTAPKPAPLDLIEVLEGLHTTPPGFPAPVVHDTVAYHLRPLDAEILRRAATLLSLAGPQWPPALPRTVAFGLLQERLLESSPDPLRLALKQLLRRVSMDGRSEVIDRVVPYARVPAEAGEQMRAVAARPSRRLAVLKTSDDRIPDFYLRRASTGDEPWVALRPSGAKPVVGEVRELLHQMLSNGIPPADDAELDRLIRRHEEEEGPIVVLLWQAPDQDLVTRLSAAFPRLSVIFVTEDGDAVPDAVSLRALTETQERALVRLHEELRGKFVRPGPR